MTKTARLPLPFRNICRSYVLNTMSFFSKADFSIVPMMCVHFCTANNLSALL